MTTRRPRDYRGINHETIGSDIVAVLQALSLPEQILGVELTRKLSSVDPNAWYPIALLLDSMAVLHEAVGPLGMRKMGRRLFKLSHEDRVKQVAKSARDIVYGIDDMYHHANRGVGIGGWKVLAFEESYAELEKTTPHVCFMEEGIFDAALHAMGAPSHVRQSACFLKGAEACRFEISSSVSDKRWTG